MSSLSRILSPSCCLLCFVFLLAQYLWHPYTGFYSNSTSFLPIIAVDDALHVRFVFSAPVVQYHYKSLLSLPCPFLQIRNFQMCLLHITLSCASLQVFTTMFQIIQVVKESFEVVCIAALHNYAIPTLTAALTSSSVESKASTSAILLACSYFVELLELCSSDHCDTLLMLLGNSVSPL
ncbi:hypothetical protein Pelo_7226 [Pelomyxa schiedti]|nr:hypothetical protein Pelo_7226 [Pelomyxa schiedti]